MSQEFDTPRANAPIGFRDGQAQAHAQQLGRRRLGEGIIAQGNVLLYDETGKEVAHLIVEVTPLGGSRRVEILNNGRSVVHYQCGGEFVWCVREFKPKEVSAEEHRPDGTVRREYK